MATTPKPRKLREETLSRRAARAQSEREILLAAATEIFGDRGYHEASMRDIAEAAGFSMGALYERFESKDELYCEVVQAHFSAFWGALDRVLEQPADVRTRLLQLTALIFEHNTVHRTFLRMYEIHSPTLAEPYQARISQMRKQERGRRAVVDTVKLGQRERLIVGDDSDFLGSMYYGMVTRAASDYLANRRPLPEPDRLLTLFLDGASPQTAVKAAKAVRRPARVATPAGRRR